MCTILIAWRCLEDADFVVAGNRDELVARPAAGPARLSEQPAVFGGLDLLAGGTWLAVRADGALAAVTNRRADTQDEVMRDPSLRSRGELPLVVLREAAGVHAALQGVRARDYNPFNLLVIDSGAALVGHAAGAEELRVVELEPGLHVLCVHDVDDARHSKEVRIRERLSHDLHDVHQAGVCVSRMTALLGDHDTAGGDDRDAVCIHGDEYGTVSASAVWKERSGRLQYTHAPGRPCVTPFVPVALA